jgi:hypothetical protein
MKSIKCCLLLASAFSVLSCEQNRPAQNAGNQSISPVAKGEVATDIVPQPRAARSPDAGDGIDDGYPDLTPALLTAEAEQSVKGARNILISFARAIELKEYGQAWAMLSPADQQKWSKAAFAAIFADLDNILVAMPVGTMEGDAGSSYYTAPIAITARDAAERFVRIEGKAVLRRITEMEAARPEPLRWQFESVVLSWKH